MQKIDRAAYNGTTLIGKLGVESNYEPELHGTNGFREVLVNAQGRSVEKQGAFRPDLKVKAPTAGEDLLMTLDMPSQRVAEEMLKDKRGAAVAIDPQSGDVLVLVSRPAFDPNLFGRGLTRAEFQALNENIDRPLFNRALRGTYPSGSTIKPAIALAALVNHEVNPDATRFCNGVYRLPGSSRMFREGRTGRHGAMDLRHAIAKSCDVYFYDLANTVGVDHIAGFLAPLGFGSLTGIDIGGEKPGILPSREWKRKTFSRPADQMWFPGETVNFGIGQGYFLVTPLQLAHYVSILANRGTSYKPRLVNGVRDPATGKVEYFQPQKGVQLTNVTPDQWQIVLDGMVGAVRYGTAAYSVGSTLKAYTMAGKTGTAQVFTVAQNASLDNQKTVSERLRDHSWFIAFAPAEAPRIAVAVIVENGGFGSAVAAPIVRKIMDTYLLDANGQLKVPLPAGTKPLSPYTTQVNAPGAKPDVPSHEPSED
jgi:penicillin-binding protein 2